MIRRFSHAGTARLLWAPLALLMAWPVGAVEQIPASTNVSGGALLTQAQPDIPAEVQSWFDGAKAAAAKGDAAEAMRLQKQVMVWLEGHPGAPVVFRARALINFGVFLRGVGQRQEALPPIEAAVRLLRPLAGSQPEAQRFLAIALNNLGNRYSELGRSQEALAPTEEALKIYRELAKTNPAYLGDLARSLNNLGNRYGELGRSQEALAPTEEAVKIRRELA
jgi:tetratricopeptide (TPR) repeat protein